MFERFTERARQIVVLAQQEARLLNHNYVGSEHVLLGLLSEGEGIAAQTLSRLGIDLESLRQEVESRVGRGTKGVSGHLPFTPRAKKVMELSLREALQLGHNYIGTEHLLLGLVREAGTQTEKGIAVAVLQDRGLDLSLIRQEVIAVLSDKPRTPKPVASSVIPVAVIKTTGVLDWIERFRQNVGPLSPSHPLERLASLLENDDEA